MKNTLFFICSIVIFGISLNFKVKAQAVVQATANAEVIEALTTTETAQLNFGRFSPETQGGKIIMTPDGVRTAQGTVVLGGGTHNSASFYITGQYEATFSITLPSGPAILTNTQNNKTMEVTDWSSYPAPGIGVGKLVGGSMTVRVGAVLNVGDFNANPVGFYAGIYAITFAYN
jgi:Domain of unknown function (DUF4402)